MTLDSKKKTTTKKAAFNLEVALANLPTDPGVYRMYGAKNKLIYVGKAKNLRNRVRSYFQKGADHSRKVRAMVSHIKRFDYLVTDSEVEALILEATLINQRKPKYNILLRDDKKYPWIGISGEDFPRVFITRSPAMSRIQHTTPEEAKAWKKRHKQKKNAPHLEEAKEEKKQNRRRKTKFFGPYTNSGDMYRILEVIRTHFPLRQRKKPLFKNRPCMNYDIGACPGPCQNLVSEDEYNETLEQVQLFLKGRVDSLLDVLEGDMHQASEHLLFERAAKLRDRHKAVVRIAETQKVFYDNESASQDILSYAYNERLVVVQVLTIRRGKLTWGSSHELLIDNMSTPEEAFESYVNQHVLSMEEEDIPDEIILPLTLADEHVLTTYLAEGFEHPVSITVPKLGTKLELLDLAKKNANEALKLAQQHDTERQKLDPTPALLELQDALELTELPLRIECYDISHMQGSQTVASMVVLTNGRPDKSSYRRFKINSTEGKPDDFTSMHEVITRRFSKDEDDPKWPRPDLVIVDGGKGQLSSAVQALKECGITPSEQPIVSLAKKFEEVFKPEQSRPILLPRSSKALLLLQLIRDESHRFAITYHRKLRGKSATTTTLDTVKGIGPKTQERLLAHFGSIQKLKEAQQSDLDLVTGLSKTQKETLWKALHAKGD